MKHTLILLIIFLVFSSANNKAVKIEDRVWFDVGEEEYIYFCGYTDRLYFLDDKDNLDDEVELKSLRVCKEGQIDSIGVENDKGWINIASYTIKGDSVKCTLERPESPGISKSTLPMNLFITRYFDTTINNIKYNALYMNMLAFDEERKDALFISEK